MSQIRPIGVSGSIPSVNQLALGDIAINTYDGKAYIKKAVGNTQTIVELGSGGGGSSVSSSYATTASYAVNGGVTQIVAGTNVTISPTSGKGVVTVNAVVVSSGSGSPNGPLYSLQYNNGGLFSGSSNLTLLNGSDVYLTGSLRVSGSITGSLFGTASWALNALNAVTASYSITSSYSIYAETASISNSTTQTTVYVKNQSGNTISKGLVVRITGSNNSSDIPRIVTASYENDNNSANTLGIAKETILDGSEGYVITEGVIAGIDTTNYISGQLIYLGATGSITGSAPMAPFHAVRLGEVVRHQSNNGSIYVRIDNGYELGELHDVKDTTTTSSFGDLLIKSGSVWTNSKSLTGSYSITGSLIISGSSTFINIGPAIFSGSVTGISGFTGSLEGTSSWSSNASTASYIVTAQTASYVLNAVSSSYASTSPFANTASYATTALSASYALQASSSLFAATAQTASYILTVVSSSFAQTASFVRNAQSASYSLSAVSASFIPTASYVVSGSYALTATSASYANTAGFITLAQTASYVINAISSSFASTSSYVNNLNQAVTVGNITSTPSNENTINVYPPPAGGTGEGGQILLAASGGLYLSASMLDTWQDQFRILKGTNTGGSTAAYFYMNLTNGNTQFTGAVTASAYSGLPNSYLYVTRTTSQTIGSGNWANRDIVFNTTVYSNGISYDTGTGLASLTAGKVYRITARLAWSAAATYLFQFSCYDSANTQLGPTVEIIQPTNASNNTSDGTLDFIYVPASNTTVKIRTTANTTALSGEYIRGDLNTQFIIQQIA